MTGVEVCIWSSQLQLVVIQSAKEKSLHFIFVRLHDYSLLKVIKYNKLLKSGMKGEGARDERKGSSASVFEVANANGPNDLTRGKCEFLSPAICRQKKMNCNVFSIGLGLLHSYKMPSDQTLTEPPRFHLEIPDDILEPFGAVISLFCLRLCLSSTREAVSVDVKRLWAMRLAV